MAVTDPRPGEALATGDAVNAAARLEQAARARAGARLGADRAGRAPLPLRPGAAARAARQGRAAARASSSSASSRSPRARCRASARRSSGAAASWSCSSATYRRAIEEGQPHLVTLYGEAGVGKSRLVGELLAGLEAAAPTPRVVRGRCLAYGDGITLLAARGAAQDLRPGARHRSGRASPARACSTSPQAVLAAAGADAPDELAATLAASIGLGSGDAAQRDAAGAARRDALRLARPSSPRSRRMRRPSSSIEDLHWADAAVLELIEDVADHAGRPAVLPLHGASRADRAAPDLGRRAAQLHRPRRRAARRRARAAAWPSSCSTP